MIFVKKLITSSVLATFLTFSISAVVLAKNVNGQIISREEIEERLEERKLDREEKREEIQERLQLLQEEKEQQQNEIQERNKERKASISAKLTQAKVTNIHRYWNNLGLRFTALIDRLEILVSRIDSRLTAIETEDFTLDTESIHESLDSANLLLNEAKDTLSQADEDFTEMLESEDPKAIFEIVKEAMSQVKDNLKEVHTILVKVIGDIKGLRVGEYEGNVATPTEVPSPTETITL